MLSHTMPLSKANTCTRQSREFNTVRDLMSPPEGRNRAFQATNCFDRGGTKICKAQQMANVNLDEAAKGRSVESTKGEHFRQKPKAKIHGEKGRIQIRLSGFSLEGMFCVIVSQKHSNQYSKQRRRKHFNLVSSSNRMLPLFSVPTLF